MARLIELQHDALRVWIAPEYGGMPAKICTGETQVLRLDETALETAPMAAGGCPVLFPFAGKFPDDTYILGGRRYTMPLHGLVKNAAFAVCAQSKTSLVLRRESCPSEEKANYPFAYTLELGYYVENGVLAADAAITNHSDRPMPHAMGWHPYFWATDKKRLKLTHSAQIHYNHHTGRESPASGMLDLSGRWDDVFHTLTDHAFCLENPVDGYRVTCEQDAAFSSMIVCSFLEKAVCIEPWCAFPDPIQNNRFLLWTEPGQTCRLRVRWKIEALGEAKKH